MIFANCITNFASLLLINAALGWDRECLLHISFIDDTIPELLRRGVLIKLAIGLGVILLHISECNLLYDWFNVSDSSYGTLRLSSIFLK